MIKETFHQLSKRKLILFYGNQSEENIAFSKELDEFSKKYNNFSYIPTLATPSNLWPGETGYITHSLIKKYVKNINEPIYYICGSPAMVNVLYETLFEMEIDKEKIKVEDFPGY